MRLLSMLETCRVCIGYHYSGNGKFCINYDTPRAWKLK